MNMKIMTITTIAVLATFMTISMTNDALANGTDIADFKCDKSFGSFYTPTATGLVVTGSWADCTLIGQAGLASIVQVGAIDPEDPCVGLTSTDDAFVTNEKGFITFSTAGTQCFHDSEGDLLEDFPTGFCGGEGTAYTSELNGTYEMTDGLVDGKRVVGGSGFTSSSANHCAGDTAPFGNSGSTSIHGDIHTEVEE